MGLPREGRQETVRSLREAGLSLRAIQSATGVSRPTVISDVRSGGQNLTTSQIGTDGKTYSTRMAEARERSEQNARVSGTWRGLPWWAF